MPEAKSMEEGKKAGHTHPWVVIERSPRSHDMKNHCFSMKLKVIVLLCALCLVPLAAIGESFGGFGLVVAQLYDGEAPGNLGGIVVLHVLPDGEAHKAGIRAGDVLLEIDGEATSGRTLEDIVLNSLRGEVGTSSRVLVKKVFENKTEIVMLKRSLVAEPGK